MSLPNGAPYGVITFALKPVILKKGIAFFAHGEVITRKLVKKANKLAEENSMIAILVHDTRIYGKCEAKDQQHAYVLKVDDGSNHIDIIRTALEKTCWLSFYTDDEIQTMANTYGYKMKAWVEAPEEMRKQVEKREVRQILLDNERNLRIE